MLSNQQPYIIIKKGIVMNNDQKIKIRNFDYLNKNILKGKILFTGSSLMEQFPICEIARSK